MTRSTIGVASYLRGIDFSNYSNEDFNYDRLENLNNLEWLKLDKFHIKQIPSTKNLEKLNSISLANNQIEDLKSDSLCLKSLKVLNLRRNKLQSSQLNIDGCDLSSLLILDLSYNKLNTIPFSFNSTSNLTVLNISNNSIVELSKEIFGAKNLKFVDVSNNELLFIPVEIFNLSNLQQLNISGNPLSELPKNPEKLTWNHLKTLSMSNLGISSKYERISGFFQAAPHVLDIDLSNNNLDELPSSLFSCTKLERLNLSYNNFSVLPDEIGYLRQLKFLSVSFNLLTSFPKSIGKLKSLKHLYANCNQICVEGIPETISNLLSLEYLSMASNKLQSIKTQITCLVNLKTLILTKNDLRTLPPLLQLMKNLQVLDTKGNPNMVMQKLNVSKNSFESWNFSYDNVRNYVIAYLKYKQKLQQEKAEKQKAELEAQRKHSKVSRGKKLGSKIEKVEILNARSNLLGPPPPPVINEITINKQIKTFEIKHSPFGFALDDDTEPPDYSQIFPENVGKVEGVFVMAIEDFMPVLVPEDQHGKFFTGDCYLILESAEVDNYLDHKIFIWIGRSSPIDKRTCVAVHSVSLRSYVGSTNHVIRIEDSKDDKDAPLADGDHGFRELFLLASAFHGKYEIIDGVGSLSKFTEKRVKKVRHLFYRIYFDVNRQVCANLWPFSETWLDQRFAYILDSDEKLYIYFGKQCGVSLKMKARLFAEKVKSGQRNGNIDIIEVNDEDENNTEFWDMLKGKPSENMMNDKNSNCCPLSKPILYKVVIGIGYIELPQVEYSTLNFSRSVLESECTYILDTFWEVYAWYGKSTNIAMRKATLQLAQEILSFFNRPSSAAVIPFREGFETMYFKSNFQGWADFLSASNLPVTNNIKPKSIVNADKSQSSDLSDDVKGSSYNLPEMDISALLLPKSIIAKEKSESIISTINEDLESMESFVIDRKGTLAKLRDYEIGHFYTESCYIFICSFSIPIEDQFDSHEEEDEEELEVEVEEKFILYFWDGCKSPKSSWLNFSFQLKKPLQQRFKNKLEIIRVEQQKEPLEFLALFNEKLVIHEGMRPSLSQSDNSPICSLPEVNTWKNYQVRTFSRNILAACVEMKPEMSYFSSEACNIVVCRRSFESDENKADVGSLYIWKGSRSSPCDITASLNFGKSLAKMYGFEDERIFEIEENEEHPEFLSLFPSSKFSPNTESVYFTWGRCFVFCMSSVSDLEVQEIHPLQYVHISDYKVIMIDTGIKIFIYMIESLDFKLKQFLLKLLPIYQEHQKKKKWGPVDRKIAVVRAKYEPTEFKALFHGWFSQ